VDIDHGRETVKSSLGQATAIALLNVVGVALVYAGVLVGEAVSTTPVALYVRNDLGVSMFVFRIVVLSLTAAPITYLTGRGLVRWPPTLAWRAITTTALLFSLMIGLLQVYVYTSAVLLASVLKVIFVVIPLALVARRTRPAGDPA
jgi:hypothetical protein